MALNEKNSNDKPTTGVAAIQIVLAMGTCLPTLAYRISMKPATNAMASSWTH